MLGGRLEHLRLVFLRDVSDLGLSYRHFIVRRLTNLKVVNVLATLLERYERGTYFNILWKNTLRIIICQIGGALV